MTPPLTSSTPSTPSISDHESPLQQEQQESQQEKVDAHSADDVQNKQSPPSIESTDATVKTDIDLHHETATTTTIVHLPFQLSEQCPPPKVISWMKSHRAARHKTSAQHHHHHKHHRHHPHQRSSLLQHILPFLDAKKKRGFVDKTKKGDQAVTLFSIQVTVLGKVSVPSIPSQDPHTNDIAPDSTRTVPAQLDRSETTSYVIHRTFEDFERLSEMVLRMGHSLHGHDHHSRRHGGHDSQGANISPEVQGEPVTPSSSPTSRGGPALTALSVHHPHPGLYQTLLKQFSNVKANQRAFDASSTTHGFNEEGAFERVLELNQYLENVWYWLLPENHPPHLDLSHERHEIIQWFKPLAQSAHADGRQMRERPPEDEQKRHSILQQYGSMSSIRREPTKDKNIDAARSRQETLTTVTAAESETSSSSLSSSSSSLSQEAVTSGHTDQGKHNYDETRSLSVLSVPSLSSSSSYSSSSVSSISIPSEENQSGDRPQDDGQGDTKTAHETSQIPSTATSSTLESFDTISEMANEDDKEATIHIPTGQEQNLVSDPSGLQSDVKVKRRMSISHVFRSLTSPRSTHIQRQRQSMYETGNKRTLATSESMPITTGRNSIHHETLSEEIYIWNTVTTKYSHHASST